MTMLFRKRRTVGRRQSSGQLIGQLSCVDGNASEPVLGSSMIWLTFLVSEPNCQTVAGARRVPLDTGSSLGFRYAGV